MLHHLSQTRDNLELEIQSLMEELASLTRNLEEVEILKGLGMEGRCGEVPRRGDHSLVIFPRR